MEDLGVGNGRTVGVGATSALAPAGRRAEVKLLDWPLSLSLHSVLLRRYSADEGGRDL